MDTFGEDVGCLARRRTPNAHSLEAAAQKREKDRDRDGERERRIECEKALETWGEKLVTVYCDKPRRHPMPAMVAGYGSVLLVQGSTG